VPVVPDTIRRETSVQLLTGYGVTASQPNPDAVEKKPSPRTGAKALGA
jgi:hypothetical protein